MTRLLTLRALCGGCERAEARVWCASEHAALCLACSAAAHGGRAPACRGRPAALPARAAVAPLCNACGSAPAARGARACDLCCDGVLEEGSGGDTGMAIGMERIWFERMDFSGRVGGEGGGEEGARDASGVDLSYFQTSVPRAAFHGRGSPT